DIRTFRPDAIPEDVLLRILDAAHHAGSVGLMQPWNFLIIRSQESKEKVYQIYNKAHARSAEKVTGKDRKLHDSLKMQGILQAPINLIVTCDRSRGGPHVYGRD